jgi:hypothetical protein
MDELTQEERERRAKLAAEWLQDERVEFAFRVIDAMPAELLMKIKTALDEAKNDAPTPTDTR